MTLPYGTREEHIDWCKKRALEYWTHGDLQGAVVSMLSDMRKHKETFNHSGLEIGNMWLSATGPLKHDRDFVLRFIEGFH